MTFKQYNKPSEYSETVRFNFNQIDGLEKNNNFIRLAGELSSATKIDYKIILITLKRFLMTSHEYYPDHLKRNIKNRLISFSFIIWSIKTLIKSGRQAGKEKSGIILDNWAYGVMDNFYGKYLVAELKGHYKCKIIDFNYFNRIKIDNAIKYFPGFKNCLKINKLLQKSQKIDLSLYIYEFFKQFLTGLEIRELFRPEWIISGNDNGLSRVKAVSSGAKLLLIQNGSRLFTSDGCFLYSDIYISMGSGKFLESASERGCIFSRVFSYGSLRLYNYLNTHNHKDDEDHEVYDVLYVSAWHQSDWDKYYHYSREAEEKNILLLIEAAENSNLRFAYRCRYDNEIEHLLKAGLVSDKIFYIPFRGINIYDTLIKSRLVLSAFSTSGLEAMGINKKVGFINQSGNQELNSVYSDLKIEYTGENENSLLEFIDKMLKRKIEYNDYIIQNQSFVKAVVKIIDKAVSIDE